jgi:hypothetical protein
MKRLAAAVGALAGCLCSAAAQPYPGAVEKVIAEARLACGAGVDFKVNPAGIARVDVFRRGKLDYVLTDDSWSCADNSALFTGSGGAQTWIVSDVRGSHELIFEMQVRRIAYVGKGQLQLDLHGIHCNKVGSARCRQRLRWNGRDFQGPPPR